MLEIMKFVFSSFWIWLGTMAILTMICETMIRCSRGIIPWKEK